MPTIRVVSAAADELAAAAAWYESERPGLGARFRKSIERALDLLEAGIVPGNNMPNALGRQGVRRLILRRFPFDIVFVERGDMIVILAFAHHSRRPLYWRTRLPETE